MFKDGVGVTLNRVLSGCKMYVSKQFVVNYIFFFNLLNVHSANCFSENSVRTKK